VDENNVSLNDGPVKPEVAVSDRTLPDFRYIKRLPIVEVARELGIHTELPGATWTRAHCFRPENHKANDRTPSLNFQVKKNKFMCFHCDERLGSTLDLVMAVEQCDQLKAGEWFDEHYPGIPRLKAKPNGKNDFDYRAGVDEFKTPDDLVKAGMLPHLTNPALRVFTVLAAYRDENDVASVSYETIKQKSGIGSDHTVSKGLRNLEGLSIMNVTHKGAFRSKHGGREQSQYAFTFDDPELFEILKNRPRPVKGVRLTATRVQPSWVG
jgi:hypothetical protein